MNAEKTIVLTDAAHDRLDKLYAKLRLDIEKELRERLYVPGDDTVEVTASDVDELAHRLKVVFPTREYYGRSSIRLLPRVYLAMGIITFLAGLFYPYLESLRDNPTQAALVVTGLLMSVASILMFQWLKQRDARRVEQILRSRDVTHEKIRDLELLNELRRRQSKHLHN
jgi:hypothetical protein